MFIGCGSKKAGEGEARRDDGKEVSLKNHAGKALVA